MKRAGASVVVEAIRSVGLLLRLDDYNSRAECMDRSAGDVNHFALIDVNPVKQLLRAIFVYRLFELLSRHAGLQSQRNLRSGLGMSHVPAFSFAPRFAEALGGRVVRMHLNR